MARTARIGYAAVIRGGIGIWIFRTRRNRRGDRNLRLRHAETRLDTCLGTNRLTEAAAEGIELRFAGRDRARIFMLRTILFTCDRIIYTRMVVGRCRQTAVGIRHLRREEAESDTHGNQTAVMPRRKTPVEVVPRAAVTAPPDLAQRTDTRIGHIVEVIGLHVSVRDVCLAEEARLDTLHAAHLLGGESLLRKIERIALAGVEYRGPDMSILTRALAHVEVEILSGHHHRRVSLGCGLARRGDALPTVDLRVACKAAAGNGLVPYARHLAQLLHHCGHAPHEICLQLFAFGHAAGLHQGLAVGTRHPLREVDLVAADMEVTRGEDCGNLTQNIL